MKKHNILFLSSWYPSKAISTLGNFVQRHAEAVATMHNVQVLYVTFLDGLVEEFKIEEEIIKDVRTTIVYCRRGLLKMLIKKKGFIHGIEYLKQKNQFQFDFVHHNIIWDAGWQARWLYRKYGLPYIITEHWTGYDLSVRNDQPFLLRILSKYAIAKCSMLCPVTENLKEVMQRYGLDGKYTVISNVVDTRLFLIEKKDSSTVRFLHVSTLDDNHKNISGILRTWKHFSDGNKSVHLMIGGDGPHEVYQKLAQELLINQDSITFFGEKKSSEIALMMQQSHCFLLFSNFENLPCVIIEALASGMAIISTDVGGIKEHIDKSRGYLIPKGDERELLRVLMLFKEEHARFVPEQLHQYAEENFSIDQIAKKFDSVYRQIII